jgi:hypothetical protein
MIAFEWKDVDLGKRQLCIQRSELAGHRELGMTTAVHASESGGVGQRDSTT